MGRDERVNTASPCVLVTRPRHQAQQFVSALEQVGLRAEVFPLIEIVPPLDSTPFKTALHHIADYDMLLLTSVNAVNMVLNFITHQRIELPSRVQLVSVGPSTLKCLQEHGYNAITPIHEFTAEGVVELLHARGVAGLRVLYPRAELARDVIVPALQRLGAEVDAPVAYRTIAATSKRATLLALLHERIDIVTFTSSSAVHNYVALLDEKLAQVPARVKYASIGPITSATAREYHLPLAIEADPYTIPGLVAALKCAIS
ncbi:MAG: uroporphyrinogen-III synthase [Desulfuromonadaceae bacterium]|nr:uroporphyrinogen-III synthase [Desulfuromonadaceae bacterium]